MSAVVARILLRYLAAALLAKGFLTQDSSSLLSSDPEVVQLIEVGVGAAIGAATELWYFAARRLGWSK